ncbi:MAG: hypothetical protein JWQ35_1138 [Bacteriovoracaceae bacterium]|nr:hypothetical protein [Bacteriovoracaceae bacterium]
MGFLTYIIGLRSVFVAVSLILLSGDVHAVSPFGLREGQRQLTNKKCATLVELLSSPKQLIEAMNKKISSAKQATQFHIVNLFSFGLERANILEKKLSRGNSKLWGAVGFNTQIRSILRRQKKIKAPFDMVEMAKNYANITSPDDLLTIANTTLDYFESVRKYNIVLSYDLANTVGSPEPKDVHKLLESQFLLHSTIQKYDFMVPGDFTRVSGGPSYFCTNNSGMLRISTELAAQIPYYLIPAAVLWHREIVELFERNESVIALWMSQESPGMVMKPTSKTVKSGTLAARYILRDGLKEALIENTVLRRILELYRKTRDNPELRLFQVRQLENWANMHNKESNQAIGNLISADYKVRSNELNLGDFQMDVESIVYQIDGKSLADIHAEKIKANHVSSADFNISQ